MYNPSANDDDRQAQIRAQMETEKLERQKQEELKKKEAARNNLKRKINDLRLEMANINNRTQLAKQACKQMETDARKEGEGADKNERELARLKTELQNQKAAIRRTETKIADLERHHSDGRKQQELKAKEAELKKLDYDHSDIDHQIMRYENELRNIR